jgi:hypothetical protein
MRRTHISLLLAVFIVAGCDGTCPPGGAVQQNGRCQDDVSSETDDDDASGPTSADDTDVPDDDLPASPTTTFLGNISFYSREAMDQFCAKYDRIYGDASIVGPEFDDAADFGCLKEVQGSLYVANTKWTSWKLPNLEVVGWGLSISGNADLTSLTPSKLIVVGDTFSISGSPLLSNLDTSSLTIRGGISIASMDGLTDFAIAQTEHMYGSVSFSACANLESIDLSRVSIDAENVSVVGLPALRQFHGVGVDSVDGYTYVFSNPLLALIDLSSLQEMSTHAFFGNAPDLVLKLDNLAVVHLGLSVPTGLAGLSVDKLTTVEGPLSIGTTNLVGLDSFGALRRIDGDLTISGNSLLTSVAGLSNVEDIGGNVSITSNGLLGDVAAQALVDAIGRENIAGTVSIYDN